MPIAVRKFALRLLANVVATGGRWIKSVVKLDHRELVSAGERPASPLSLGLRSNRAAPRPQSSHLR
jgi:hypothetical protein